MNNDNIITGAALERHYELQGALFEFARLFEYDGNERVIAIVGGAFCDMLLEHILKEFFIEDKAVSSLLDPGSGALGPFMARARTVYCLGLINKFVFTDLRHIAQIRNEFAHNLKTSFQDDKIVKLCNKLQWHRVAYMKPQGEPSAQDLFQVGVNQVVGHLSGVVLVARNHKRQVCEWSDTLIEK